MPPQYDGSATRSEEWDPTGGRTVTTGWWFHERHFGPIWEALAEVRAIDYHSHLLWPGQFDPSMDAALPLRMRSSAPMYARALDELFAVDSQRDGLVAAAKAADNIRAERVASVGETQYWHEHLDRVGIDSVLVNQDSPRGTDGARIRWVPFGTDLLYPLDAPALAARSPRAASDITGIRSRLPGYLRDAGTPALPEDLDGYLSLMTRTVERWSEQGAAGIKLFDAYYRTIRFEDVDRERARDLYRTGQQHALMRDEYLELQDHLAWHLFDEAGRVGLPVHIHCSAGDPPFLRLSEGDVRNLENALADVRFFGTRFVLIHGGVFQFHDGAYLAMKPHVWADVSAMPFLFSVPELANILRVYLALAPAKVLFGTDAAPYPCSPVGPEVMHAALARELREAVTLALAGMVRDGMVGIAEAIDLGTGVLQANAATLLGDSMSTSG